MVSDLRLKYWKRPSLPVIRMTERAECGLACIAMVARYHGHDLDLNGLRERSALSGSGATLRTLIALADNLGLSSRPLKVELEDLRRVRTPAILHWGTNHFVVLKAVRSNRYHVHDPARGARVLSQAEVSNLFTGVVLDLEPKDGFRPVTARAKVSLGSLFTRSKGLAGAALQVLALSLVLQIASFVLPFQLQLAVDEGVLRSDVSFLVVIALGFAGVVAIQCVSEGLRGWALQYFGQTLAFQMVGNVVRHLMRLQSSYFEKRHVGDILSRVGSSAAIQDILTRGVVAALIDGVMAVFTAILLVFYSPILAAVILGSILLNIAVALAFFPVIRRQTEDQLVEKAAEQSHLMETVRAATVFKIMGRESEREGAWRNLFARSSSSAFSVGVSNVLLTFLQRLIIGLQMVLVIYLGARQIIDGAGLSIGMLFAIMSFRQTLSDRAMAFVNQAIQFRFVGLHLDRLADIVTAKADPDGEGLAPLPVQGGVTVEDVTFQYGAMDKMVLNGVNLTIQPGEFVAIKGVSGGGKTTLIKIMLGLCEPTEGRVLLDGRPATPELWRGWREAVGVVSQDDRLLSGSIAENIAFFDPDMDMGRVMAAATAARVNDDILRSPMQYMTLVGDMGSSLSGGQKQRVLLARALYREPKILILDEGTANLDARTEDEIADLVSHLPMTRIVVAHRPALIRKADRVLELQDGRLQPSVG